MLLRGASCSRRWFADLFFKGRCGGGTASEAKRAARGTPGDPATSPPGEEANGESGICGLDVAIVESASLSLGAETKTGDSGPLSLSDEFEDAVDRAEALEVVAMAPCADAGVVGVPGVELLGGPASKKRPFCVCRL